MQTITGRVTDRQGQPVSDAILSIVRATAPVQDIAMMTDGRGRFSLIDLPEGKFRLQIVSDDGSERATVDFSVPHQKGFLDVQLS